MYRHVPINNRFRVKVTYDALVGYFTLQLPRNYFGIWISTSYSILIREYYEGNGGIPGDRILSWDHYQTVVICQKGHLNLKERSSLLYQKYVEKRIEKEAMEQKLKKAFK